jgi:hypothetical protein
MTGAERIHNWLIRLIELAYGDMDYVWQIINREMECTDDDREELRLAFHNRARALTVE